MDGRTDVDSLGKGDRMNWEYAQNIAGVHRKQLQAYTDMRGTLTELFRRDWLDGLGNDLLPQMAYVSITKPGIARGPHEHREQTDIFAFMGQGCFRIWLWDARKSSPTFGSQMVFEAGVERPTVVIVPPCVVHGYKNISAENGMVLNFPNRLYAGYGKSSPVDEIRHEDDKDGQFIMG